MTHLGPGRYGLWGAGVALAAAATGLPFAVIIGAEAVRWGLLGWFVMAAIGVGGGSWKVSQHGDAGSGFLVATGTCMLARLLLSAAGAFAAATRGPVVTYAYLVGLGAGYFPVQVLQMRWFLKRDRARS